MLGSVYLQVIKGHLRYTDVISGSLPTRKFEIESARVKDIWSCDWLNVSNLIMFDRLVMMDKIMNKLSSESLWDKFELRFVYSKYETRNCHYLQIPRLNAKRAKIA